MGSSSRSPRRNSTFRTRLRLATPAAYSTIFSELSMPMTFSARWARSRERVPSPAPISAMRMGGRSLRSISERPFQERPGT